MWFKEKEDIEKWKKASNLSEKDELSISIEEISPINLEYLNSELSIEIPTLCSGYDAAFGSHDASAFIRREEEKVSKNWSG